MVLRRELLARGLDDRAIARLLRAGDLHRVRHGAYVDASRWRGCNERERHQVRSRAVLRQARKPLVLSHATALLEWGAPLWDVDLAVVEVTRNDARGGRREAGVRQHHGALRAGDVETRNGVAVTSPSRTALDAITIMDVEHSLVVVNDLLHRRLTTPAQLDEQAHVATCWPGSIGKNIVLRLATGACESVGESRVLYLCWDQGLPAPVPQLPVVGRHGRVIAYLDFAWPHLGVFLEFDGRVKYEALLSHHESATDVVLREKRREEMICELTGWRCLRVSWSDLSSPERLSERVRALFAAQAGLAYDRRSPAPVC